MIRAVNGLIISAFLALALAACEVDKTQEGEAPEVNVEGGEMPKYDVDPADVDVGTEKKEVTVPTIDVNPAEEDDQPSQ